MSKESFSSPPGGFPDAKTPSETLRKRNGSFPSVESDFPTPRKAPGRLNPPFRGCQKNRFQALPGAFLTPKRLPKRCENATVRSQVSNLISPLPGRPPGGSTPGLGMAKEPFSSPPWGFPGAQRPSEKLRKFYGSFPSVESDFPTPRKAPGRLNPPFRGCQKNRFQALPGAFLTPNRPPKRCATATVRSQVSNLISPLPGRPPGGSTPRFGDVKRIVFKPSRGLSSRQTALRNAAQPPRFVPKCRI